MALPNVMDGGGFIHVVGVIGVDVDVGLIILLDFHNLLFLLPLFLSFVSFFFSCLLWW